METLSPAEIEAEGLSISYTMPQDAAPNPKFSGPGLGGGWEPDYTRYAPELAQQVRREMERQS